MQQALDEIKPGLIVGVIVSHGCQGRGTAAEGSLVTRAVLLVLLVL
jgi:hypothetical protein